MNRLQTLHEAIIPLLVEGIGARSYLELGTHLNETIARVKCAKKYGVDISPVPCPGAILFGMTIAEFLQEHAAKYAPYDAVFIDGEHEASTVLAQFDGIWPHVSDDGLVFIHDCNPETVKDTEPGLCGDAWKASNTLLAEQGHEGIVLPYHPGLMIIRKRTQWGPK